MKIIATKKGSKIPLISCILVLYHAYKTSIAATFDKSQILCKNSYKQAAFAQTAAAQRRGG